MSRDEQGRQSRQGRAPPRWNIISVCAPFAGFLGGAGAGVVAPHFRWFEWGFRVWLPFCVFGLVCAGIALLRAERLRGVTEVGLALNAALTLILVGLLRPA
jgi:hypothetical protein